MRRDPLAVLARIRNAAVTDARRALATGLQQERAAQRHVAAQDETMQAERSMAAGTADVAAFAAWWPVARHEAARLQEGLAVEQGRVQRLQQALVARRMEAEGVAEALKQRRDAEILLQRRAEQAVLDEAAARTGRRGA